MCSDTFSLFWDSSNMQWVSFDLFGVVALLKSRQNAYSLLGKDIVSNISTLRCVLVEAWLRGVISTCAFYTQRNTFLTSSTLHECIRSCACVKLAKGSTSFFSAHMQLVSSKINLFTLCMQLTSDPINLSSNSRVTRV